MNANYPLIYLLAVGIFFAVDIIWLSKIAKDLYQKQIGNLLLKDPNWPAAAIFYLMYILAIVIFAVNPAVNELSATVALQKGALFGLFAYGTYDLTNLATLKGWTRKIVVIDMIWGTVLTGTVAYLTYLAADWLNLIV